MLCNEGFIELNAGRSSDIELKCCSIIPGKEGEAEAGALNRDRCTDKTCYLSDCASNNICVLF